MFHVKHNITGKRFPNPQGLATNPQSLVTSHQSPLSQRHIQCHHDHKANGEADDAYVGVFSC